MAATTAPTVLVTRWQFERFGERLTEAVPAARFLTMADDGEITDGDTVVSWEDAHADVAFGSADVFDRSDLTRRFFGWLLRAEQLEWLQMASAGVDHEIFGSLLDRGVRLTTAHVTAIPIAEYVLAQVLRTRLPLDAMAADRTAKRWRQLEWDEVHGSRWVVVGLGAIGTEVAVRAKAFGAHVTGIRRTPSGDEPVDAVLTPDRMLDALGSSDVIVLAAPATAATVGMIDADALARMRRESILVNVGRGSLVDEEALRRSLDAGRPGTAILDVAADEPPADDHWLWDHPKVVLTAHTAAGGTGRYGRAADLFAENLRRWSRGRPLHNEVTAESREAPPS